MPPYYWVAGRASHVASVDTTQAGSRRVCHMGVKVQASYAPWLMGVEVGCLAATRKFMSKSFCLTRLPFTVSFGFSGSFFFTCIPWCFQVVSPSSFQSRIYKVKRKPRELTTLSSLSLKLPGPSTFSLYLPESS